MKEDPKFRRVLLKLSGEALMGGRSFGLDPGTLERIATEVKSVHDIGIEVCLVVGGGNIFRGIQSAAHTIDRTTGDYMGMLATVMNSLAIQGALERLGVDTRVQSAIPMSTVSEPYIRRRAVRHLQKGRVVIFAAGTGNPFFTTDTAAALRASEMNCDALFKGTKVDGVYSDDPAVNPAAARYESLTFTEALSRNLKIMDATAIALARENGIPILVFSIQAPGSIAEVVHGRGAFTMIDERDSAE